MLGETLNNLSELLMIDSAIIPNIITICVVIGLIYLTFKMNMSGLVSLATMVALYTASMGVLSLLGIDSVINIFTLFGETLGA